MENIKFRKKNNAITLISLVITIVIMLILAGVTINLVIGNNGIFNKSQVAAQKQYEVQVKENIEIAMSAVEMENAKTGEQTTIESIYTQIGNQDSNINITSFDEDSGKVIGIYTLDGKEQNFGIIVKDGKTSVTFDEKDLVEAPIDVNETFAYTGDAQEFVIPQTGKYKIELWGASGGKNNSNNPAISCNGAYTSGEIMLSKGTKLYFYIGQNGQNNTKVARFNGGGYGGTRSGLSGGGATDVRLTNGAWDSFDSLKTRIMVAGAGGGSSAYTYGEHSSAGGLTGYSGDYYKGHGDQHQFGKGGTQTAGGQAGSLLYSGTGTINNGSFGIGGDSNTISSEDGAGGGGGGYYGGGSGGPTGQGGVGNGGGGGSSFISGHNGCNAIAETSTVDNIIPSGTSVFYKSKYVFTNTKMIDGASYNWTDVKGDKVQMPNTDGTLSDSGTGHVGDGFARIVKLN